jgi:hypothetical protein
MIFDIIFAPEVKFDIQEAIDWYNSKQEGLGKLFLTELKKYLNLLQQTPKSFAIRYNTTRCLPLKKFPFLIHYRVDDEENTIYVDAILHTSRNPEIWKYR